MIKNLFVAIALLVVALLFCPNTVQAADPIVFWNNEIGLPYTLASHQMESFNNRLYVFGGGGAGDYIHSDILKGELSGSPAMISSWSIVGNMPDNLLWLNTTRGTSGIYVLGGTKPDPDIFSMSSIDKVSLYEVNPDGSVATPRTLSALPDRLSMGGSFVFNNRIYYVGGFTRTAGSSTFIFKPYIYYASILSDGSIGGWTQSLINLPEPRAGFSLFINDNRIVIAGGMRTSFSDSTDSVITTTINLDGTLNSWESLSPLPYQIQRAASGIIDNNYVLIGGLSGSTYKNSVIYAPVDINNKPVEWLPSNSLPVAICCSGSVTIGSRLFLTGGHDGSYLSSVYNSGGNLLATPNPTPSPTPTPVPTSTPIPITTGAFELPISYPERLGNSANSFRNAFWNYLTAPFDHVLATGTFRSFVGTTSTGDCPPGSSNLDCYDSHNGTDFSHSAGVDIMSVSNGTVVYTSDHSNVGCTSETTFGCVVIVRYSGNLYGLYAHLSKIMVNIGNSVTQSTKLGEMGNTGCAGCGVHLHFGVLKPVNLKAVITSLTKKHWAFLLAEISHFSIPKYPGFCTYITPTGDAFAFVDPSGWKGADKDPWSLPKTKGGCGVKSNYLWKFDVGTSL